MVDYFAPTELWVDLPFVYYKDIVPKGLLIFHQIFILISEILNCFFYD